MKINSNIGALTAANSLGRNERAMNQAMTRLSTGVRINSAKDDAAGLAITSKMTAQINGLKQAVRNSNDAISMVQVVEGATQEITSMLQRMRELALQSISDSNTDSDRKALDNEFQELVAEIGRISDNTQWNGTNLLDGHSFIGGANFQVGSKADQIINMTFGDFSHNNRAGVFGEALSALNIKGLGDNPDWTVKGAPFGGLDADDDFRIGVPTADGNSIVIYGYDRTSSGRGPVQVYDWDGTTWNKRGADLSHAGPDDYSSTIVGALLSDDGETIAIAESLMDTANGADSGRIRILDWNGTDWELRGIIDGENADDKMVQYGMSANGNSVISNSRGNDEVANDSGQVRIFDWDGTQFVQRGNSFNGAAANDVITGRISMDGNSVAIASGGGHKSGAIDAPATKGTVKIYDWNGAAWSQRGAAIEGVGSTDGATISGYDSGMNTISISYTGHDADGDSSNGTDGMLKVFDWDGSNWVQRGDAFTNSNGDAIRGTVSSDGNSLVTGSMFADPGGVMMAGQAQVFDWDGSSWVQRGSTLTGSAAVDMFGVITIANSLATTLSVNALDFNGAAGGRTEVYQYPLDTNRVIKILDGALDGVNNERAKYGAVTNRLEYTVENLTNIAQNTAAARSRILDTDYARETTELARTQIIQQASTAMLSQANQQGAAILELLRPFE